MSKIWMSLLLGAFMVVPISYAQTEPAATTPAAASEAVKQHRMHEHGHEHARHSEIHKAMRKLKGAKHDLVNAHHDFGGHKAKAIAAINSALEELRDALQATDKR